MQFCGHFGVESYGSLPLLLILYFFADGGSDEGIGMTGEFYNIPIRLIFKCFARIIFDITRNYSCYCGT